MVKWQSAWPVSIWARIVFIAFLILPLLSGTLAEAACTCGSGVVPCGVVCCSGSTYCQAGNICTNGGCLSRSSPRVCSNGSFCNAGEVCTPDGRCLSQTSERYCGGREFCGAGTACIGGGKCLAVTSERYCGNGRYCSEGSYCSGGGCRSHAADAAERVARERAEQLLREAERLAEDQRRADEERQREAEARERAARAAAAAAPAVQRQPSGAGHPANCSTITGPNMGPGQPCPDDRPRIGATTPPSTPPARARTAPPPPKTVLIQPPPPCGTCRALDAVGEILPAFGKLLQEKEAEINSPNIPPPQEWIVRRPASVSARPLSPRESDLPNSREGEPGRRMNWPDLDIQEPFAIQDEIEADFDERCKRAIGEYLSGADNPIEQAKKKIRDLKKEGNSQVAAVRDAILRPMESLRTWWKEKREEIFAKYYPENWLKTVKEQILKAETPRRQEDLRRFEEKWGDKCAKDIYTKDIEPVLQQVADDLDDAR